MLHSNYLTAVNGIVNIVVYVCKCSLNCPHVRDRVSVGLGLVLTAAVSNFGNGDSTANVYHCEYPRITVTGQLANEPTRSQSSRGLVNSRSSQLAEMFDLKFGVYNSSKCYFKQITLFIRCHIR